MELVTLDKSDIRSQAINYQRDQVVVHYLKELTRITDKAGEEIEFSHEFDMVTPKQNFDPKGGACELFKNWLECYNKFNSYRRSKYPLLEF